MKSPFLIGPKLYLRRIQSSDLNGSYFDWLNDQEVTRWMQQGVFPNSQELMEIFYKNQSISQTDIVFAIVLSDADTHVGNIRLHEIHQVFRSGMISLIIGEKDYWGKGLGTEAIELLAGHAFKRLNLNRLHAGTAEPNVGCIRAYEKAGFRQEGISRKAYFCEGEYVDVINLSLLRDEWSGGSDTGDDL